MTVDRPRIARLVSNSKSVDALTLNPSDSDQVRQSAIRKLADLAVRKSNQRSVLVIVLES